MSGAGRAGDHHEVCEDCKGQGFTLAHDRSCDGQCCGACPVQEPCEECWAWSRLPDAERGLAGSELVAKLRKEKAEFG